MASDGPTPALETTRAGTDPAQAAAQRDPRRTLAGRILGAIVIAAAIAAAVAFRLTAGVPDNVVVAHVAVVQDLQPTRSSPAPGQVLAGLPIQDLPAYRWPAIGSRVDLVGTHTVATTFYERGGRILAVSVVSGGPVREPGPVAVTAGGDQVHAISLAGRAILSWRHAGHTIVMSSIAVPTLRLIELAQALNRAPVAPMTGTRTGRG
jgi:hypothetical protein